MINFSSRQYIISRFVFEGWSDETTREACHGDIEYLEELIRQGECTPPLPLGVIMLRIKHMKRNKINLNNDPSQLGDIIEVYWTGEPDNQSIKVFFCAHNIHVTPANPLKVTVLPIWRVVWLYVRGKK